MIIDLFKENDKEVNDILSKIIMAFMAVIPAMIGLNVLGVFSIDTSHLVFITIIGAIATLTPRYLLKKGVNNQVLKYYIVSAMSVMIAMLGVYPHFGIYITLVLGMLLSLFYFDKNLTIYASVLCYVLMIITEGFRMHSLNGPDFVHAWIAYSAGFTIEFALVAPMCVWISVLTRRHLVVEHEMSNDLIEEQKRYELALGSSKDVIFEYDIEKDEMRYYGPLLTADFAKNKKKGELTVETEFFARAQSGGVIHSDDIFRLQRFADEGSDEPIQIRYIVDDNFEWLEVEGSVIYRDDEPAKVVGKIRNITDAKFEEQEFLQSAEKDELTGFFDRRIGVRIIRQQVTEAGRADVQTFLYVSLNNINDVVERGGRVFADAILLKMTDIMRNELSDMDLPIRFSESEFVLYLVNRTPSMVEQMQERMIKGFNSIYLGKGLVDKLDIQFEVFSTREQMERAVVETDMIKSVETVSDEKYRNDIVSFALNMLERNIDFDSSLLLLLDRITTTYDLECIRIFSGSDVNDAHICIYEWIKPNLYDEDEYEHIDDSTKIQSMLGSHYFIDTEKASENMFITEHQDSYDKPGYIVYIGESLAGDRKGSIEEDLSALSKIIASYLDKRKAEDVSRDRLNFLYTMSHEIRTPLNSIAGFADLIMQDQKDSVIGKYADSIRTSSNELLEILNDIIDLTNIENNEYEIRIMPYFLHSVVENTSSYARLLYEKNSANIEINVADDVPDGLVGDERQIKKLLNGIVGYSSAHDLPGEVKIDISFEKKNLYDGVVRFDFWDPRFKVSDEEVRNAFKYNGGEGVADSQKRRVGLALSLAKHVVELMKGSISMYRDDDAGFGFIVDIPQEIHSSEPYDYNSKNNKKTPKGIPFAAPWARVMIVDDNRVNMEVAKGLIGKYKVEIVTASSGFEALSILESDSDFDIIFMDHLMPDLDGVETTRRIRGKGDPSLTRIPIVAITANAVDGAEGEFFAAGINGYLEKPINLIELSEVMDRFIPADKRE